MQGAPGGVWVGPPVLPLPMEMPLVTELTVGLEASLSSERWKLLLRALFIEFLVKLELFYIFSCL